MKKPHEETTEICMAVIKGTFAPDDLAGFAESIERRTVKEIEVWCNQQQNKPLLMIRAIGMIKRIALAHGHEADFIKRRVIDECKKYDRFVTVTVPEWEAANGGEGSYMKMAAKSIRETFAKLEK